ncbi:hypothetical protein [Marinobacterium mangrovicola]|uniref:Uncharacterized protein n=1 Tax=Marinobacterium mangrovicola TaxID=1476959 RepID=A0A4R1GLF1_9GAMM|nr:hypothetical protein [Marinobacterium mangrovicola]TCK09294.1 hypothetical protein CLV83_1400 [Marinobacterium mangrovicola]
MNPVKAVLDPFILQPERAFMVAGLFLLARYLLGTRPAYRKPSIGIPLFVGACAWCVFGVFEISALLLGPGLGVDYLLNGPLILIITLLVTLLVSVQVIKPDRDLS